MALNIAHDRIIKGMQLGWSIKCPIVAGDEKTRSSEWLNVNLVNVTQEALPAGGKIFRYYFTLDYYAHDMNFRRLLQEISDIMDAMGDVSHYISGGVEYFYDGLLESVIFENEDEDYLARLEWSCQFMEIG